MTTLAKVNKAAKRLGALADYCPSHDDYCLSIEAPKRKLWACSDTHELVSSVPKIIGEDHRPGLFEDALARMAYGLRDCEDPDCEWCNSEEAQ